MSSLVEGYCLKHHLGEQSSKSAAMTSYLVFELDLKIQDSNSFRLNLCWFLSRPVACLLPLLSC